MRARLASLLAAHRIDLCWAGAIFVVAFGLRLAFVSWLDPSPASGATDDSWFYHFSARGLVDGRGFVFPGRGEPTAQWPPGYPAVLAAVYVLPGPDILMAKLLNVSLGALTASLVFVLGAMLWDRAVGVVAGLLFACFPSHIFHATLLLTEVVYTALLTGILLLFFVAVRRRPWPVVALGLAAGVGLGVATLIRGEAIVIPLVLGAVWFASTRSLAQGAAFTAAAFFGVAIVLSGWTVRNAIQMGSPIPVSTGSARMAQAHWSGADGGPNAERVRELNALYAGVPYPEREVKISQQSLRDGLRFMVTHPLKELTLIPRRLYFLYQHDHSSVDLIARRLTGASPTTFDRLRTAADAYYFMAIGWGALGTVLWWRASRPFAVLLLGMVAALSGIVGLLYAGVERYHAALIPLLCLAAAPTLLLVGRGRRDAHV